jgi:zinc protease
MESVIEEIKTKPIDPVLLEQTKMNFRNSAIMYIDNPTAIAQYLSNFTWVTGNPESLNTYFDGYNKVTPKDIMRVAQKYFVPNHLTVGTIAPTESVKF